VDETEVEKTRKDLVGIIDFWLSRAEQNELVYSNFNDNNKSLLADASVVFSETSFPTLNSLRDVDQESNLHFVKESLK
jgi:hypothetical protein